MIAIKATPLHDASALRLLNLRADRLLPILHSLSLFHDASIGRHETRVMRLDRTLCSSELAIDQVADPIVVTMVTLSNGLQLCHALSLLAAIHGTRRAA